MATPQVPQRPSRSKDTASTSSSTDPSMPQVPPRPSRNPEKSMSPSREFATRSPLNDSPFRAPGGGFTPSHVSKRPSIQSLPIVGAEGEEYASLDQVPQANKSNLEIGTPKETKNVAGDLPLYAPTASTTTGDRSAVAPVVRTNTATAVEAGIGKTGTSSDSDDGSMLQPLRPSVSRDRAHRPVSSSGLSREITHELSHSASRGQGMTEEELDEHGIPHFGQYVPMYPNAGDVQAPSPSPWQGERSTGVGFFNDSSKPLKDQRRRSAAHAYADQYGLHGHGTIPQDQFEKAWYQRHPEELKKEEQGQYGPASAVARPDWALSSDELNKLVRSSSQGGFGTSDKVISVPTEMVGYQASAEYASKSNSPHLSPTLTREMSQPHTESPLRNATVPGDNEVDQDRLHLDPLPHKTDRYTGMGLTKPTIDLGPEGGNTTEKGGWFDERGTGTPILASDEVLKVPGSDYMQPAISPEFSKHPADEETDDQDALPAWQRRPGSSSGRRSRQTSRPTSAHYRHHDESHSTGTPLNEIEEYEPLFKDDDGETKRPLTAADKLKQRPNLESHRFPSQDIWEDTPNSLRLETTVGGPQEEEEMRSAASAKGSGALFESPDMEKARQAKITEHERLSFLQDHQQKAKPKFNAGLQDEVSSRPGMSRRFPSRDIWEDTPDSLRLETTVDPEEEKLRSPEQAKLKSPLGGENTAHNNLAQGFAAADKSLASREVPAIPARPTRTNKVEQAPSAPVKPTQDGGGQAPISKPTVPARPARTSPLATEPQTLNKVTSGGSTGSAGGDVTSPTSPPSDSGSTSAKAKPTVPAKPSVGSKFASIKAGFMENLNSRLATGPTAPKSKQEETKEAEEEKTPLADARKGRARGPARRAQAATTTATTGSGTWGVSSPTTIFHIHPTAGLHVPSSKKSASTSSSALPVTAAEGQTPQIAGETTEADPEASPANAEGQQATKKAIASFVADKESEAGGLEADRSALVAEEAREPVVHETLNEGAEGPMSGAEERKVVSQVQEPIARPGEEIDDPMADAGTTGGATKGVAVGEEES